MPPELPQAPPDHRTEGKTNEALCDSLVTAARDFLQSLPPSKKPLWMQMIKMMELARRAAKAPFKKIDLWRVLTDMDIGGAYRWPPFFRLEFDHSLSDVFFMRIRAQNAALIVRRLATADFVQFEVFEVSPQITAVMTTEGKLLCSYPGPAIQVPLSTFMDKCFLRELSSFLVHMDVDHLVSTPTTSAESVHPRYISELLVGILRGYGQPVVIDRITKRIGDEVLKDSSARQPWRRSPLWLALKVTLQSSLRTSNLYKPFVLFFHAHLLRTCVRRAFPSELLYAMRLKMALRFSKLGTAVSRDISQFVYDTAKETESLLSKRWTTFQCTGSIRPTSQFNRLDFVADSNISLHNSYEYLTKTLHSASLAFPRSRFTPSHTSRFYDVYDFTQFANGQLAETIAKDKRIAIADFELSVERNLESWVATSTSNDDSSEVIASCIQQYCDGAKGIYGANAEGISVMILTIMDLWVALDRIAIQEYPLLKEYSPEIPSNFLHCLLLHRQSALKRASHIEEYLHRRHKGALWVPSVFSNTVDYTCFAVKYYRASKPLNRLYDEITVHAQQERAAKRKELATMNQKSNSILNRASRMKHERSYDFGTRAHSTSCQKCQLEFEAENLRISVHEWPLPRSPAHAQYVVFELSPPRAFSAWRGVTYMILRDIGMSSVPDPDDQPRHLLYPFSGLQQWVVQHQQHNRLTIGSDTDLSSSRLVKIPATEPSVFVDLKASDEISFRLLDRNRGSWAIESFSPSSVSMLCVPPIPKSSPYKSLHLFVSGIEHTQNRIIAAQANCPDEINLHEFIAFSGLRSGPRLQWLNIARELASPSLSFRREEVHTLITQAAWQLGPLSNGTREWHIDLSISSFGEVLLRELECLLEKIRANWLEEVTVRTIGAPGSSIRVFVSSVASPYLQPSSGLSNGSGYLWAGVCAVARGSTCNVSMDR